MFDGWHLRDVRRGGGIARDSQKIYSALLQRHEVERVDHSRTMRLKVAFKGVIGVPSTVMVAGAEIFWQSQVSMIKPFPEITQVVRIHDVFPLSNPEWFSPSHVRYFRHGLDLAEKNKAIFVANSEFTATQLLRFLLRQNNEISVIPCSVAKDYSAACDKCDGCIYWKVNPVDFDLAVGTIEPRKNYSFLVDIYRKSELNLVIIGRYGWGSRGILNSLQNIPTITWLSNVCDGALDKYFNGANRFVCTSLSEGFNIPAGEAAVRSVPLVLSDIPSHRELHPGATLLPLKDKVIWTENLKAHESWKHAKFDGKILPEYQNSFEIALESFLKSLP